MTCEKPLISRATAHFCGRCGSAILIDPRTMEPKHVPAWVQRALTNTLPPKEYAR